MPNYIHTLIHRFCGQVICSFLAESGSSWGERLDCQLNGDFDPFRSLFRHCEERSDEVLLSKLLPDRRPTTKTASRRQVTFCYVQTDMNRQPAIYLLTTVARYCRPPVICQNAYVQYMNRIKERVLRQIQCYRLVYFELAEDMYQAISRETNQGGLCKAKIRLMESVNAEWRDLYPEIWVLRESGDCFAASAMTGSDLTAVSGRTREFQG